jgi:hypothetical protein
VIDMEEGFREVGRAGGFFPIGGGAGFLLADGGGGGLAPGIAGAAPPGGLGADEPGGLGALGVELIDSPGSDRYDDSAAAPVSMPPRFFNFGMPPAKRPPSCGAAAMSAEPVFPEPVSLLLLIRFPGTGGASPPGAFGMPPKPGTGGAPPTGGPDEDDALPSMAGADLSLVTAFFKALPFEISESRAPWINVSVAAAARTRL